MSWQPRHCDAPGTSVPRAESRVASNGTLAVKPWQTVQCRTVCPDIFASLMLVCSGLWQPL